jgi:hypothetical protein
VGARKCQIKEVDKQEGRKFLEDNHLMGRGRGKMFGLYYNDQLTTIMQIINHKEYTEISRFCHKNTFNVVGGFSKLLKYIELNLKPQAIKTFIDKRYGNGEYLVGLGFELKSDNLSFKWIKNDTCFHRMAFPGNSGYEQGYYKMWDCGQKSYIKYIN